MAKFWPSSAAKIAEAETARRMNSLPKIVFSKYPADTNWKNVKSYKDGVSKVICSLELKPGKNIAVLGSSNLSLTLIKEGLLDEVRLMVNPLMLGSGTILFESLKSHCELKLTGSTIFGSGNVLLTYDVVQ